MTDGVRQCLKSRDTDSKVSLGSCERIPESCPQSARVPLRRRLRVAWCEARHSVRRRCLRWIAYGYKWSTAFHIAYGHIEFARAKDYSPCRIGPAFRVLPDQSLIPHERTDARSQGIQTLKARFGVGVCGLDLEIFLMGFDAGEEFVLRTHSENYIETFMTSPRGGNSMPLSTVRQSTTRDPSTPLPSRV